MTDTCPGCSQPMTHTIHPGKLPIVYEYCPVCDAEYCAESFAQQEPHWRHDRPWWVSLLICVAPWAVGIVVAVIFAVWLTFIY